MSERAVFDALVVAVFVTAVATWIATGRIAAPYGRHGRGGWGPEVGPRLGWIAMEAPSVFVFAVIFAIGPRAMNPVPLVLMAMWLTHYVHRALLYPMRLRSDRRMPLVVVAMGFFYNVLNSYLNGRSLSAFGPDHDASWLLGAPFVFGLGLFAIGFAINRWADRVLENLRGPGETGYKIPRGGLYELISCPNYFGEIVQWTGFAIAAWSWAGLSFAVFTAANLIPRARAHHAWYRRTFDHYPTGRRAVVPFLL